MKRIYLHGLGQTPASWEETVARLGSVEDSVCPDLAGLLRGREATYGNLYGAFAKACQAWEGPFDVCGLSLGGVLALQYAAENPGRVRSLALIAPQYRMPKGLLAFQNLLFQFMPRSAFRSTGFGKAEFVRLCKSMMELDFSGSLPEIRCPVLVLCGERDSANRKAARELAGRLKNARLQVIPGAGHEVNLEAPEQLAEALREFWGEAG